MKDSIQRLVLLASLVSPISLVLADVEVFSASHILLANVPDNAVVVELDALAGLDELFSFNLPADQEQAALMARQRMQTQEWALMRERYEHAAMAVARAWLLGVEKLPAVVMDGRVVYGEPDVAAAVTLLEEALSNVE